MCEGHHGGYGIRTFGHHQGCCCGQAETGYRFRRRFRGRDERVAELEAYLKDLEAEVQGVREALDELRGTQQPSA